MRFSTVPALFAALIAAGSAEAVELSGGLELESASAYVYNGVVYSDEPVASYGPWLELSLTQDFWLYGNFWQLYDLTDRRREEGIRGEWNETDFDTGIGGHLWKSDDGAYRLSGTLGWYWETEVIDGRWSNVANYSAMNLAFANPFVTPYVYVAYDFVNMHSMLLIPGIKRSFEIADGVSLEARLSAVGGHKRLLRMTFMSESAKTGIGSVEGRLTLKWNVTEYLELSCFCAMLGNVNSRIREDWCESGDDLPDYYSHEEFVYGGITANFSF